MNHLSKPTIRKTKIANFEVSATVPKPLENINHYGVSCNIDEISIKGNMGYVIFFLGIISLISASIVKEFTDLSHIMYGLLVASTVMFIASGFIGFFKVLSMEKQ